jgi:hypothetical protein
LTGRDARQRYLLSWISAEGWDSSCGRIHSTNVVSYEAGVQQLEAIANRRL